MRSIIFLIDVSNAAVSKALSDRIYRTDRKEFKGILGREISDWKSSGKPRKLVVAAVNFASSASGWTTIDLPTIPVSYGGKRRTELVSKAAKSVRDSIQSLRPSSGMKGTQVIFGLERLCAEGYANPSSTIYIVTDGIEQSERVNMFSVQRKSVIYSSGEHKQLEERLLSEFRRAGVKLGGASTNLWLTGSETQIGRWNQVLRNIWTNVLVQSGARNVTATPLNSVAE